MCAGPTLALCSDISPSLAGRGSSHRGFTLTELLAAIAIIVVIATITAVSVRGLAREARQSSATNAVVAALDTGRAIAIRDNTLVAVVFRPRLVGDNKQQIEIVTARWTGETPLVEVQSSTGNIVGRAIDRFEPVSGVASRRLPAGISVAGPLYHSGGFSTELGTEGQYWDETWGFASHLPTVTPAENTTGDPPGRVFAVIFASDGAVVLRNAASNAWRMFVDFNNDGLQQVSACTNPCNGVLDYSNPPGVIPNPFPGGMFNVGMMMQHEERDEPYITAVPFLAVYSEDNFRDMYDPLDWVNDNWQQKHVELTEFVNDTADRIHFNRYTGVVMR